MLREADKDQDGLLLEPEWLAVELWFQYRAFQPGGPDDLEAEHALEWQAAKKEAYDRWARWGGSMDSLSGLFFGWVFLDSVLLF